MGCYRIPHTIPCNFKFGEWRKSEAPEVSQLLNFSVGFSEPSSSWLPCYLLKFVTMLSFKIHAIVSYFLFSVSCYWKWPGLSLSSWSWSLSAWATHPTNNMSVSICGPRLRLSDDQRNAEWICSQLNLFKDACLQENTTNSLDGKSGLYCCLVRAWTQDL